MKAKAVSRPGCGPSRAAMATGRRRTRRRASVAGPLGQGPGSGRAWAGPGGLASGLGARAGPDWRGCGLAGKCECMGASFGCAEDGFAYSPHNYMQGRAGESSPALLCLGFPLNTFDFFDRKSNPTTKVVCGQFPGVPPAAEGHRGNFPADGKFGRSQEFGGGVALHGDPNYSPTFPNVSPSNVLS